MLRSDVYIGDATNNVISGNHIGSHVKGACFRTRARTLDTWTLVMGIARSSWSIIGPEQPPTLVPVTIASDFLA